MWIPLDIQLNGIGSGIGVINVPKAQVWGKFAVPAQAGVTSGATNIVVTEIAGSGNSPLTTLLTITNIVTPYSEILQRLPVDKVNAAGTSLVYQLVGSLQINVVRGSNNARVTVWVLL